MSSSYQLKLPIDLDEKKEYNSYKPKEIIDRINLKKWKKPPFKAQNWGNWIHHMGAYVGKIKPAMANILIRSCTRKNDKIFDPFCGIGTIPTEAELLGRIGYGNDLSPYPYAVARAKFSIEPQDKIIMYLDSIKIKTRHISLKSNSDFMKQFYHPKTLKEILFLLELFKKNKKYFLLGCLLGIIHGHRPGHLSAVTSLVIPYIPKNPPIYKEVIPKLKAKVKRMFKDGLPTGMNGKIYNKNAMKIPVQDCHFDAIISSPPYYNTLDYVNDNKLRLEFLGLDFEKQNKLKKKLTQSRSNYIDDMIKVGIEMRRVLKKNKYCIFVLGDLHSGKNIINTAENISNIYHDIGFKTHKIIEDSMPINKAIPSKIKRKKSDRILIMEKK